MRTADRLLWLANGPSPYNDALFTHLHHHLGDRLQVFYASADGGEHEALATRAPYRARPIRNHWNDAELLRLAARPGSRAVVGGWQLPIYLRTLKKAAGRGALWTDTPDERTHRPALRSAARNLAARVAFRHAHAILGTGKPALGALERMGAPHERLHEFPYFTSVPEQAVPMPPVPPLRVLSIGRSIERKRLHDALEVAHRLREQPVTFDVVGDGPLLASLKTAAKSDGLNNVTFHGWRSPAQVKDLLDRCHVLLHTASWEPYGVVVLEAMAQGRVVVASDGTMAAVDRIQHGHNGYLFGVGKTAEAADVLARLQQDGPAASRVGAAAHASILPWRLERAMAILDTVLGPFERPT